MATYPTVTAFTEQVYRSLPEFITVADAAAGWPLLRYLSLEADHGGGGTIAALVDRLDPSTNVTGFSDLLNAGTADAAWLPWLAQLRGVKLVPSQTLAQQRVAVASAAGGWIAGTSASIAAAAATVLTGQQRVYIYPYSASVPGDAGPWDLLILTRPDETPDPTLVTPAVIAAGAKPAGVLLHSSLLLASYAHLRDVHGSYTALKATFPTYQSMTSHIPE